MRYKELKEIGVLSYRNRFPRLGTFRVIKKKTNGELRLFISLTSHGFDHKYDSVPDSSATQLFIWLGRYLALKGKLPSNILLNETAVLSGRVQRQIREVLADQVYRSSK